MLPKRRVSTFKGQNNNKNNNNTGATTRDTYDIHFTRENIGRVCVCGF